MIYDVCLSKKGTKIYKRIYGFARHPGIYTEVYYTFSSWPLGSGSVQSCSGDYLTIRIRFGNRRDAESLLEIITSRGGRGHIEEIEI